MAIGMPEWFNEVERRAYSLEARYADRDSRMTAVKLARTGSMDKLFPQFFSEDMPYQFVANFIDTTARDLSESVGPLPSLTCSSVNSTSDEARFFDETRAKIGWNYWTQSNLNLTMFQAADHYFTYGFSTFIVEPDKKNKLPKIRILDPFGTYPEFDRDMNVTALIRRYTSTVGELYSQFGENALPLLNRDFGENLSSPKPVIVYRFVDKDRMITWAQTSILQGQSQDTARRAILSSAPNPMQQVPVFCAIRPSHDDEFRGQFDDVLGVQAARAILMRLMVDAVEQQVQAPIVVPDDVPDLPTGANAIIRTSTPQGVHRVDLSVGQQAFGQIQNLEQELLSGARYPAARNGGIQANVITGRGVEALMGGFDGQIKTAQIIFAECLRLVTNACFEMDQAIWPEDTKSIVGVREGAPFELSYRPIVDIRGVFTCEVTYGFLAGLDPNRALVFMLQLHGDKLIDRETIQKHMPFDVDTNQLRQNIDIEELQDALKQGVMAYVQTIGPMAAQGQDPTDVLKILASTIQGRREGKPLETLLMDAFAAAEAAKQAAAQAAQEAAAQAQGGAGGPDQGMPQGGPPGPGGQSPMGDGLPPGVAPGQAGMGPGGRPSVSMLMAGMGSSGNPDLHASVRRVLPA